MCRPTADPPAPVNAAPSTPRSVDQQESSGLVDNEIAALLEPESG